MSQPRIRFGWLGFLVLLLAWLVGFPHLGGDTTQACQQEATDAAPPPPPSDESDEGWVSLFNGKNLDGWKGLVGNPLKRSEMNESQLVEGQAKADKKISEHWWVEDEEIVSDGHGPHLCTIKDYRDFEMTLEWKIQPGGDSGIYLRGSPQVQIWDPFTGSERAKVGSGGLFNNQIYANDPIKVADKKPGEWNHFRILMIGERVTVHLNEVLVVEDTIMENYWDRAQRIFPSGQIELQTHGNETRFRHLKIRELDAEAANRELRGRANPEDWQSLLGDGLDGWQGAVDGYQNEGGVLTCTKQGGILLTEKTYSDFEIDFEFQLPEGGNNGLALRAPPSGDPAFVGLECQILDNSAEKYQALKEWQYHGSIYGLVPALRGFQRPVGEWNHERVSYQGSKVRVELNGFVILEADLATIESPIDGRPHPGRMRTDGHVGFCGHGDEVLFRHVRIREL